jgi:hypothetical protein
MTKTPLLTYDRSLSTDVPSRARRPSGFGLAALGVLAALSFGCSSSDGETGPDDETATATSFIGTIPSAGTSIAVVTAPAEDGSAVDQAVVYVCDGVDVEAWYTGSLRAGSIDAESTTGLVAQATVTENEVTGTVELPGKGTVDFSVREATGVAGIYLVEQTSTKASGFSASLAKLQADIAPDAAGFAVTGTITPAGANPVAIEGNGRSFGEAAGVATWIVQADGEVKGSVTNTAGGGNCSIWKKIRSVMTGVDCSFL